MWPIFVGLGLLALAQAFAEDEVSDSKPRRVTNKNAKKKIFISFAIEDQRYRDFLVTQGENDRSPFTFIDMSVKQPWNEVVWKRKCRKKIKRCDGMIVLLSKSTWHSGGLRWEVKCAKEEGVPVIGMHIKKSEKSAIPPE